MDKTSEGVDREMTARPSQPLTETVTAMNIEQVANRGVECSYCSLGRWVCFSITLEHYEVSELVCKLCRRLGGERRRERGRWTQPGPVCSTTQRTQSHVTHVYMSITETVNEANCHTTICLLYMYIYQTF